MINFKDKLIVVTGASQGIGRETSILLDRLGAKLILIARSEEGMKETIGLMGGTDTKHCIIPFDLNESEKVISLCKEITKKYGKIDGLAYCAGITQYVPTRFTKIEDFEKIMRVNTLSFHEMIKGLSIRGSFNERTSFVGCSSCSSFVGHKAHSFYSASKSALDSMVRCLAKELAPKGIRVNAVAPGRIKTPMGENVDKKIVSETSHEVFVDRQYLGYGEPEDVANAIAFLLSEASKFITGVSLPVDGGYTSN